MVLNLCINLVITKKKLRSQYIKLTQLWPITVNCFKVSSQFHLAGLSKMFPLHIYRPNDYTIEISVLLQIKFYNIFTNVSSIIFRVVTNILKVYELPKIYKILIIIIFFFTIIIYQVNSMSQLHLAYECYRKCTLGCKRLFWH